MVIGDEFWPAERIKLMKFDNLVLACSEYIRMEIFATQDGILMSSQKGDKFHGVSVEYFGVAAVGDDDNKIWVIFGLATRLGVLDVDDLVIEANNSIDRG